MGKGSNLGEFEQTVLFALARLDDRATGRDVYRELVAVTERDVSVASVHVTLTRLADKGLLDTDMAPGPEGLGKDVKHFALNPVGSRRLREARAHWERLWDGIGLPSSTGSS